ncbi:TetR family transcriptional regulator [Catellatospora methionotrophica]|uniref:TetR family transcriptional regulator n=1 Tax=Catellatospora methionotrophica TaxID=121620 RepID=A0A8J3L3C7_9ACTN|nr:TetR family transcriptional regulator [Catellatospora methionotrophica]GIG11735.1 TetR family transcriptional regulator [Catellatospora methionotrophica]
MPTRKPPPLRKDARRNRTALLTAAKAAFAEEGLNATLEGIARRAEVSIGTLYRHFPTRMDLVAVVIADKKRAWIKAAETAVAMESAWDGLAFFLERTCELQAGDLAFNDIASMRFPHAPGIEAARKRAYDLGGRIIERAQAEGSLRPDLTPADLAFIVWAQSRISEATHAIDPDAWRRYLAITLDGLRAKAAHPLAVTPLRPRQVMRAQLELGRRRLR